MLKRLLLASILCPWLAPAIQADLIYLKNGNVIEAEDVRLEGDYYVFNYYNGRVALDKTLVERVEKRQFSGYQSYGSHSSAVVSTSSLGAGSDAASTSAFAGAEGGQMDNEQRESLINSYIEQKRNLERQVFFNREQISTLQSVIYAKANIFADTTPERERIQRMEADNQRLRQEIEQLLRDARQQGLLPGDIRRIEAAKFDSAISSEIEELRSGQLQIESNADEGVDATLPDPENPDEPPQ